MRQLHYRLLGPLEVVGEREPLALGRRQQRALLALLLLHANNSLPTDQLVELLWPQKAPGRPQTAIQGYVSALRKLLGREAIETSGGGYLLRVDPERLDLHLFERRLAEARRAQDDARPEWAALKLSEALALWRGPALADFTYEAWAQREIGRLEELRLVAGEELLEARLALGRHAELVGDLEAIIHEHPLRERPRGQLMLALYRSGRQAEALDTYRQTRERLREDLGIDPSPDLQRLYKQILNQDEKLNVEPPSATPPNNLPAPPNPLIGRQQELNEVAGLLQREDVRLVTLTGPGGTGKTRLAHQVAENLLEEFRDGGFLVSLSAISDPNLAVSKIAQTLGLRELPDEPLRKTVGGYLRDKSLLLLLDNLEQIVEAAPEIALLLQAAPRVKVLTTSRAPLHAAAEHLYPVPPLELPNLDDRSDTDVIGRCEAVRLFVERAKARRPDFALTADNAHTIAEICVRLDGLPLAIELAAARISVLSPQAMLARLDQRLKLLTGGGHDVDGRQQTLRATIEWSYGLLSEPEQRLFGRLAVFVGGCRMDAVEAICDPRKELGIANLDGIASLVEKSLLRKRDDPDGEPRFWMLETIREYALERLDEVDADQGARSGHARFFETLAHRAEPEYFRRDAAYWIGRIQSDHANVRAALQWSDKADPALQARLTAALARFWVIRGYLAEGSTWLERALGRTSDGATSAKLILGRISIAGHSGDYRAAGAEAGRLLTLAEQVGDPALRARALLYCGAALVSTGDPAAAAGYIDDGERAARSAADSRLIAEAVGMQADAALSRGDPETASRLAADARARFLEIGDEQGAAWATMNLASAELRHGEYQRAAQDLADSAARFERLGDRSLLGPALALLGAALIHLGEPLHAALFVGAGEELMKKTGYNPEPNERAAIEDARSEAQKALGGDGFARASNEGTSLALADLMQFVEISRGRSSAANGERSIGARSPSA